MAASVRGPSQAAVKRHVRLVEELYAALDSLHTWHEFLLASASEASATAPRQSEEMAALRHLVGQTQIALCQRLIELGADGLPAAHKTAPRKTRPPSSVPSRGSLSVSLNVYLKACRVCGRALSTAFCAAQAVADAASARILYQPIRELEKQLWLLDPCRTS
jgi:hypothetical protein